MYNMYDFIVYHHVTGLSFMMAEHVVTRYEEDQTRVVDYEVCCVYTTHPHFDQT